MRNQTEYTFEYLKEKILNGTFKPSQKLTETYLSQLCGVSRSTVKKALMMLERENLVVVEPHKGASIKSYSLEEIINYLEIREVLEGLVVRSATENISADDIEKLQHILDQMNINLIKGQFDDYSSLNRQFHDVIYAASKNVQAVEMITTIKTQLNRIHFRTVLIPGRSESSLKEHELILHAIRDRQLDEAEQAIKDHVANVRQAILDHYNILV